MKRPQIELFTYMNMFIHTHNRMLARKEENQSEKCVAIFFLLMKEEKIGPGGEFSSNFNHFEILKIFKSKIFLNKSQISSQG